MTRLPDQIQTDRLILRKPALSDLEAYVAYYTGDRTGGVGGPKPRYVVADRFMGMVGQWVLRGYGRYVITQDHVAFGHVGVMHVDEADAPEITWTLWDGAYEGHGYATEAARAVLDAWTGPPLLARVMPDNGASIRVAERLGMVPDPDAPRASYSDAVVNFALPKVAA